jgi:hypothetical protein
MRGALASTASRSVRPVAIGILVLAGSVLLIGEEVTRLAIVAIAVGAIAPLITRVIEIGERVRAMRRALLDGEADDPRPDRHPRAPRPAEPAKPSAPRAHSILGIVVRRLVFLAGEALALVLIVSLAGGIGYLLARHADLPPLAIPAILAGVLASYLLLDAFEALALLAALHVLERRHRATLATERDGDRVVLRRVHAV